MKRALSACESVLACIVVLSVSCAAPRHRAEPVPKEFTVENAQLVRNETGIREIECTVRNISDKRTEPAALIVEIYDNIGELRGGLTAHIPKIEPRGAYVVHISVDEQTQGFRISKLTWE